MRYRIERYFIVKLSGDPHIQYGEPQEEGGRSRLIAPDLRLSSCENADTHFHPSF